MRRLHLTIAFIALSGALWGLWQTRYERVPGFVVLTLEDVRKSASSAPGVEWSGEGRNTVMKVTRSPGQRTIAARFGLPGLCGSVDFVQVKHRMRAENLVRGKEEWQDGRIMIEWWSQDGKQRLSMDPVGSVRDNDRLDLRGIVIGSGRESGMLTLRVEHLGESGSYEVSGLEITAVSERMSWTAGSWLLAALWGVWMFLLIRSWPEIPRWRAAAASVVGLMVATQLVVPGPWSAQRPMLADFWLGSETSSAAPVAAVSAAAIAPSLGEIPPEGKVPTQGSFILRVKLALSVIRPLLHMLLLLGPALLIFCLVGRRPGLVLMVMFALGVELEQYLFGYGFDGTDVWDLTNDAIGIGTAAIVHVLLSRRFGSRVMGGHRTAVTGPIL